MEKVVNNLIFNRKRAHMENKTPLLQGQTEYTFLSFNEVKLNEQSSCQSLFNGSIFKKCEIQNSDFSNCDFEGTIFHNTIFDSTNLSSCDIKSSYFNNCSFFNCNFSLSVLSDNEFLSCYFDKCTFDNALIRENIFNNCTFDNGSYKMSTFILSEFEKSTLKNLLLGNCSFYDHIMTDCDFKNITINIDAIGRIYGLSIENFKEFKYIFLGKIYGFAPNVLFEKLDDIFESKEWKLQRILYRYNIGKYSSHDYIIEIFNALIYFVDNNIIVKRDDLSFLAKIITVMKQTNRLPLFALYQGIEKLSANIIKLDETKYYNKEETFREFLNKMFFIFNELLSQFANIFPEKIETDILTQKILIKIHYDADKEIDFSKYINRFLKYSGYDNDYYCYLADTEKGSIIEVLIGSILCVYALQILLYGVNGLIVQITDMSTKICVLKNKNYQKDFLSNSVKGRQRQPEILEDTFDLLKNREFKDNINSFAEVLKSSKIIDISTKENPL